jgi:hypothetical protein
MLLEAGTEIIFTAALSIFFNLILGFKTGEFAKMPMHFRQFRVKSDGLYVLKLKARQNLKRILSEDPLVRFAVTILSTSF